MTTACMGPRGTVDYRLVLRNLLHSPLKPIYTLDTYLLLIHIYLRLLVYRYVVYTPSPQNEHCLLDRYAKNGPGRRVYHVVH